ncbi:MAG: hypothetical protein WBL61_25450 [Bryobacteraceae bacterium]
MKLARTFLIVVAAMLLLAPPESRSCGPFLPEAQFVFRLGPVDELPYYQGKLGIVQPTYRRRNLIVAYRYFSGMPLTREEVAALSPAPAKPELQQYGFETSPTAGEWLVARDAVPGVQPVKIAIAYRQMPGGDRWQAYQDCLDDAFTTAAATLHQRIGKWGASSAEAAEWVRGQDLVFQNCNEGAHIPAELKPGSNALLAADRRYQIAAAEFYAEKFADAERDFKAIGNDAASPWHDRAPYLVARTLVRKATLAGDKQAMQAADLQLRAILKDPARKAVQPAALGMLEFVDGQLDPQGRMAELGAALVKPGGDPRFEHDVADFTMLWDKLQHGPADRCDLADWITAFQNPGNSNHALERWRQTRNAAWLAAALEVAAANSTAADELIAAASALKPDHPAYATAVDLGLRIETHRSADAAREWADLALASRQPADAHNSFLEGRQLLARDWSEFLRYAPREPVAAQVDQFDAPLADYKDTVVAGAQFAADSEELFNHTVPLARWVDAAQNPLLPRNLQLEVAQAGWVRAIVLGRQAEARTLASRLAELKPEVAAALRDYLAQADPAAARFAAIFLMLRDPGFDLAVRQGWPRGTNIDKIDDFRDNWWNSEPGNPDEPKPVIPKRESPKNFLLPAEREQGEKEANDLMATARVAPDYLCQQTLDWARQHSQDPRVPEALHLAVRATRFGNTGPRTTGFSKAAFQLLHTKYPNSPWAAQTKFWY